jgi:Cupin-like domain
LGLRGPALPLESVRAMTQAWQMGCVSNGDVSGRIALEVADEALDVREIGLQLLAGEKAEAIIALLVERGLERPQAELRVAEAAEHPLVAVGLAHAHCAEKLASLFDAFARQLRQSSVAENVPVEDRISPTRFYEHYYFANRPVLVRGLMEKWPALQRWTPTYFAERFGDEVLEVSGDRESDPKYEDRFVDHRRRMTMRQLVDTVTQAQGNNVYLVAKNRLLERPPFTSLQKDYSCPEGILTEGSEAPARMWFGGAGTVTPLHHDASNILFGQVYGRKLVRLIPPYEIQDLYNNRTCFSDIDLDNVDYVRFPRFRRVTVIQAIVRPGDFLLFPLGWWHQVRSLDISISLSFQNFAVPGGPAVWSYPLTCLR